MMSELREIVAAIVRDAMLCAGEDVATGRGPTTLPTEVADRILALPEIAEALELAAPCRHDHMQVRLVKKIPD